MNTLERTLIEKAGYAHGCLRAPSDSRTPVRCSRTSTRTRGAAPNRITSAAIESINGIIRTARHRARGFRNFENLKAICCWMAGDLNL